MRQRIVLFALSADRKFSESVAAAAGVTLSPHEERTFDDGEHKARPVESVQGAAVYVLDSLYGDPQHTPNDKLCRMLFFIGAVRDAGAASITAVVPYLSYARADRRTKPYDPLTTRYVATLFEAVGIDALLTVDVHNAAAFENAFRRRTENLEAGPLFVRYFADRAGAAPITVLSPDAGGVKRASAFRTSLSLALGRPIDFGLIEKQRRDGLEPAAVVAGEFTGRTTIVVDDMISTGATLARAAHACVERGATAVWVAATHGLFVGGAVAALADPVIEKVVITNTVPPFRLPAALSAAKLTVLDASALVGAAIRRLHTGIASADPGAEAAASVRSSP